MQACDIHEANIRGGGKKGLRHLKLSLCTGGVSYPLFISLLISKLFCRKGCMEGGEYVIYLLCTFPSLHPSTFFALMALASLVAISGAQKSLNFQGPPLPMDLVMDVAHIKISTSRAISKTDTLTQKPAGDGRSDDPPTPPTTFLFPS